MATLLDRLNQQDAEHTRLRALLAQRQEEISAVNDRLAHLRPDAEPMTVALDRLLKGVLPELVTMLKPATFAAYSEAENTRGKLQSMIQELQGEQPKRAAQVFIKASNPRQRDRLTPLAYYPTQ